MTTTHEIATRLTAHLIATLKEQGCKQKDIAELIDTSQPRISQAKTGMTHLSLLEVLTLCDIAGITIAEAHDAATAPAETITVEGHTYTLVR